MLTVPSFVEAARSAFERAVELVDTFVVGSRWVRDLLQLNGVPAAKLLLSEHAFDGPDIPVNHVTTGPARFGYVGRLRWEKGVDTLVEALERLPEDARFSFRFASPTFASPADEERRLTGAVRQLTIRDPRVSIVGGLLPAEVRPFMSGLDGLVVPSLVLETGPLVVLEAHSVGTPVIGSQRAGIAERVDHGRTGFLVRPGDPSALASVLLDCCRDPALLRGLRQRIPRPRPVAELGADMWRLYEVLRGRVRSEATEP